LGLLFDQWLPLRRWKDRVSTAVTTRDWSEVLHRLDAVGMPVREPGVCLVERAARAHGPSTGQPFDIAAAVPNSVTKIAVMADDFDADPRRTSAMIGDLAMRLWKWRRTGPFGARSPAGRNTEVAIQLFLPAAARSATLRVIKGHPEVYDIRWTDSDLNALIDKRLSAACQAQRMTLDVLLMGSGLNQHMLVAQANSSPRTLIERIRSALAERAEAWLQRQLQRTAEPGPAPIRSRPVLTPTTSPSRQVTA
jgi:hypothetical protein